MVRFETGDLLRMPVPTDRYDVVFCRNTVIYFTEEVRDALHERLVKALAPGGYLVVGTSERVADPRGLGLTSPVPLHLPEELMETSEYLPMFLAEGREHLQELNLAVVRIEETPDDQETVDEIFRIAHSMKGMSATMGFAGMAALTHEMEDVFELLRQRTRRPRARRDRRAASSASTRSRPPSTRSTRPAPRRSSPQPLIERLQGARARAHAEPGGPARRAPAPSAGQPRRAGRRPPRRAGHRRRCARTSQMPSVRAYMVLSALAELGETLACVPTPDDVDTFDGREIDAWVVSERTDAELGDAAGLGARGRGRRRLRGRLRRRRRRPATRASPRRPPPPTTPARRRGRARQAAPAAARQAAPRPSASTPSASTS